MKVKSVEEAKLILDILAAYDQFQFQHKIRPDYSNAQGVEVYEKESDAKDNETIPLAEQNTGWVDWHCEESGDCEDMDFDEYCEERGINFLPKYKG